MTLGAGTPTVVVGDNVSTTPTLTVNGSTAGLTLPTAGGATLDFTLNGASNSSINVANGMLNFGSTSSHDTINIAGTALPGRRPIS